MCRNWFFPRKHNVGQKVPENWVTSYHSHSIQKQNSSRSIYTKCTSKCLFSRLNLLLKGTVSLALWLVQFRGPHFCKKPNIEDCQINEIHLPPQYSQQLPDIWVKKRRWSLARATTLIKGIKGAKKADVHLFHCNDVCCPILDALLQLRPPFGKIFCERMWRLVT